MPRMYKDKEQSYWERKFALYSREPRKLWSTFNDILGRTRPQSNASVPLFTADAFLEAFTTKVRTTHEATAGSPPPVFPPTTCGLSILSPVTEEELRRTILSSAPKTCDLDPVPTFIPQEFVDTLLPFLTVLCNRSLSRSLTQDATRHLVQSLILSRIDYCNVAFAGLPQRSIIRLQAVINATARLILRVKKFDHISTLMRDELQWLTIGERINFKLSILVYKCLNNSAPP